MTGSPAGMAGEVKGEMVNEVTGDWVARLNG